jgi:hypothetical protein
VVRRARREDLERKGTLDDAWFWKDIVASVERLPKRRQAALERSAAKDPQFIEKFATQTILAALPVSAKSMVDTFDAGAKALVKERRAELEGFQRRLWKYWGPGFTRLEVMIHSLWDYGADLLSDLKSSPELGKDPVFVALARLIARGNRVAAEVQALLLAGFADGALARWRTLYEISITATFIAQRDPEFARRYLEHEQLQSIRTAELFQQHAARRREIPLGVEEFSLMQAAKRALIAKHGVEFEKEFGWAYSSAEPIRTFKDLEAACDLSHVRPLYRVASAEVHAGADGMRGHGLSVGRTDILLSPGPSNAGLARAGMYTAHSIAFLAATPMLHIPSVSRMLRGSCFGEMARRCSRAFTDGEKKLARAERIAAAVRRKNATKKKPMRKRT